MPKIKKFLIVDDQDTNLLFFQVLLNELGYESVFTASFGHDAMATAERFGAQFIISSWELSDMPGTALVQRLKGNRKFYNMPFLIYSKNISENEKALLKEIGKNEVLTMPFDREKAKSLISAIIDKEAALSPDESKFRDMEAAFATNEIEPALKIVSDQLVNSSPISYKVNTLLGEIYLAMGAPKKAEEHLKKAKESPDCKGYIPFKRTLAKLYSATNRHSKAVKILKQLADNSPLNIQTMLSLSSAYLMSGSDDEAKALVTEAEKVDPTSSDVVNEKIKISISEGDIENTKALITQTENGDNLARDLNNMAIAMVAGGDFEKGITLYKQAISLLSSKVKTYLLKFNLGMAYRKKGESENAFAEFCASYISEPSYEKAYSALAKVHKELKASGKTPDSELIQKVKEARTTYKQSLESEAVKAS